jgi:hypothetical protein
MIGIYIASLADSTRASGERFDVNRHVCISDLIQGAHCDQY